MGSGGPSARSPWRRSRRPRRSTRRRSIELAIVVSGARLDLGQADAAVAALSTAAVRAATGLVAVRVAQARATALEAAGRTDEAAAELAPYTQDQLDEAAGDVEVEDEVVSFDLSEFDADGEYDEDAFEDAPTRRRGDDSDADELRDDDSARRRRSEATRTTTTTDCRGRRRDRSPSTRSVDASSDESTSTPTRPSVRRRGADGSTDRRRDAIRRRRARPDARGEPEQLLGGQGSDEAEGGR